MQSKINRMKYAASLDTTSKLITLFITFLFAIIFIFQIVSFIQNREFASLLVAALLILIYAVVFCYRPVSYQIEQSNIVVNRYASDVVLPRSEIKHIEIVPQQKLSGAVRTFGVGGMFGYFGQFLNRDLGCMTWYATQRSTEAVLIELSNHKKIIITPDKPQQFVEELANVA